MTFLGRGLRTVWADWRLRDLLPMRAKIRLRRLRVDRARRRGRAEHSPVLPAPPLRSEGRRMALTHVLIASDLHPRYIEFWPLARRAWREIAGLEPVLVLVARPEDVPEALRTDPDVRVFEPLEDVHTAFQAQCIRLLYPALLDVPGAVVVSDIDLVPMNRRFWHEPLAALDACYFIAYRDALHHRRMVAIAYNAAEPATWGEVFGVASLDDVHSRLREWAAGIDYDGVRGGSGWYTDQRVLYDTLLPWGERTRRLWVLDDAFTSFRRLDRDDVEHGLSNRDRKRISAGRYSDYVPLVPHGEHRELNEGIVELARSSLERGRREPPPQLEQQHAQ